MYFIQKLKKLAKKKEKGKEQKDEEEKIEKIEKKQKVEAPGIHMNMLEQLDDAEFKKIREIESKSESNLFIFQKSIFQLIKTCFIKNTRLKEIYFIGMSDMD